MGLASDSDVHVPTRVDMAAVSLGPGYNAEIARVCCGGYCSAAISTSGDLYMWGYAESHQLLDLPVPINTAKPRLVTKLGARAYRMPPPVVDERGRDLKTATADDTKVYRNQGDALSVALGTRHVAAVSCDPGALQGT